MEIAGCAFDIVAYAVAVLLRRESGCHPFTSIDAQSVSLNTFRVFVFALTPTIRYSRHSLKSLSACASRARAYLSRTAKDSLESRMSGIHDGFALPRLFIRGRGVMHRGDPKRISIIEVERAEIGLAQPRRVRQHRLKDRFQLAGRAGDDTQHLRRRRLLLQRLGEFLFQLGVGRAVNVSSRLRSGRTKLAAAWWALCAFERQGHLVGTVTDPLPAKDRAYQSQQNRTMHRAAVTRSPRRRARAASAALRGRASWRSRR